MAAEGQSLAVPVELTPYQLSLLDEFVRKERLPSREAAVQLLVEIGFEAITSAGRRFWDRPFPVAQDIYHSPNGDVWQLLKDPNSGRVMVRHVPNAASGGTPREIQVAAFLANGDGPEQQALRTILAASD